MSASLNAVPGFNFASVRHTPEASSASARKLSSGNKQDSFSQTLRRTADEQRSAAAKSTGDSDKKEKKPEKKSGDADTQTVATPVTTPASDKSSLPITFLLGLPSEQLESFDTQQSKSSSASSSDVKVKGATQLPQLGFGVQGKDDIADVSALMMQAQGIRVETDGKSDDKTQTNPKDFDPTAIEGGNSVKGAAGSLSANTLAFAMRLGSGQNINLAKSASSAESASPVANESIQPPVVAAATHSAVEMASGSTLEEHAHEHGDSSDGAQNVVDLSAPRTAETFDATKIAEENTATSAAQMPAEQPATAEPVRNVHMQLVSEDNRRVDVRLVDRGGELHVSVKSADAALTQDLQDHLPDLTARLDRQHMQNEVWVPKASEPARTESGNTNGSLSDPNANSNSNSSNSDGRRNGRQQQRPDWVDALENYS
jgi:hypothetical protein